MENINENNNVSNESLNVNDTSLSPITFDQIKEIVNSGNKETITKEMLGVSDYLPYSLKTMFIDDILSIIQFDENNIAYVDHCQMMFFRDIFMIKYYCPKLMLSEENIIEQYDFLKANGIIELIIDGFTYEEYYIMENLIDKSIQSYLDRHNKLESIVAGGIERLISKIPDFKEETVNKWMKDAVKALKNFSPDSVKLIQDVVKLNKGEK